MVELKNERKEVNTYGELLDELEKDSISVADTSIEALKRKKENGTLETDRERCLYIISEYGPITSEEMEIHMGKNKHAFSGRIRKLKDLDKIEVVGRKDGHQLLDILDNEGK